MTQTEPVTGAQGLDRAAPCAGATAAGWARWSRCARPRRRLAGGLGRRALAVRQAHAGAARRASDGDDGLDGGGGPGEPCAPRRVAGRHRDRAGTGDPAAALHRPRRARRRPRCCSTSATAAPSSGSAFFGWLVAVGLTVLLGVLDRRRDRRAIGADPADRRGRSPWRCPARRRTTRAGTSRAGWPGSTAPATASCRGSVGLVATIVLTVVAAFVGAQYDMLSRVSLPTCRRASPRASRAPACILGRRRGAGHAAWPRYARREGRRELPPPRGPRRSRRPVTSAPTTANAPAPRRAVRHL